MYMKTKEKYKKSGSADRRLCGLRLSPVRVVPHAHGFSSEVMLYSQMGYPMQVGRRIR